MGFDSFMRRAVMATAGSRPVSRLFQQYGMRLGVNRFVAAETLEETIGVVHRLNEQGMLVTLDYLGESVHDRAAALAAVEEIVGLFAAIDRHRLNANVSVKLTQLGLSIDETFCFGNMDRIVTEAKTYDSFVRIDMEDSSVTGPTIDLYRKLHEKHGGAPVGLVIQSYLYRSRRDVEQLGKLRANLRIVKGAYNEPKEIAFPVKADVDANYTRLAELHLGNGCYTAIATHDERIIDHMKRFVARNRIPPDRFEFQMLYGIAVNLQRRLVQEGYRVRVYTPYGKHWYPYFTRRIAERPANLAFVLKGFFRR